MSQPRKSMSFLRVNKSSLSQKGWRQTLVSRNRIEIQSLSWLLVFSRRKSFLLLSTWKLQFTSDLLKIHPIPLKGLFVINNYFSSETQLWRKLYKTALTNTGTENKSKLPHYKLPMHPKTIACSRKFRCQVLGRQVADAFCQANKSLSYLVLPRMLRYAGQLLINVPDLTAARIYRKKYIVYMYFGVALDVLCGKPVR